MTDTDVTRTLETPVLIVGGGAVGLALANELGWRGLACTVIERGTGTIVHPRTGHISVRTMEHCRRWGIDDEVREAGFPDDYRLDIVFCTSLTGYELARQPYPSMRDTLLRPTSPVAKQRCPQMWFDPVLAERARSYDHVSLRYQWELEDFVVTGDGVRATVTDLAAGERVSVRCRHLIGCDGAASTVRQQCGIEMRGNALLNYSVNLLIKSPQLLGSHKMGEAERYVFVGPDGTRGNITVVDGKEIWRLTVIGSQEKFDLDAFDPDEAVRQAFGTGDIDFEGVSMETWRRSELVADRFDAGPVMLAGDAVHTMSPTGGFGMNTGLEDAVNLGWKLEAVTRGWGGDHLLDSYTDERRPIGIRNAAAAASNFSAWLTSDTEAILDDSPEGERTRQAVGDGIRAATLQEWEAEGVILGSRYEGSPICVPDGTPAPPDDHSRYEPTCRPGHRAPHTWLDDGRSTLDLFGRGFVLLCTRADTEVAVAPLRAAARRRGVPLEVVVEPSLADAPGYDCDLVLVRPDGHVGWSGHRDTVPSEAACEEIIDVVRGARRRGDGS